MDNEIPYKILDILQELYDNDPTGVVGMDFFEYELNLPVREIRGALIYLKDKKWIKSFLDPHDEWVQKISAEGIDALKKYYKSRFEYTSELPNERPLEFDVTHDDHSGKIKVFISHKFVESDQKLADVLRASLNNHNIYGYLAERQKEYDVVFGEKIKQEIETSDYLVAIMTKNSLFAPSVHQEIGYAMGVNVPVRIMAEEYEAKGVLVEGRDMEKFSRTSFEKSLDNIIKDIIKKGHKKKDSNISSEAIQEAYRPLYNELLKLNDKVFLKDKVDDPWNTLEHYARLKIDSKIKAKFEILSSEIKRWNSMSREKEREFRLKQSKIGDVFKTCFERAGLLKKDGYIMLSETSSQETWAWVNAFKPVLLYEPNITNSQNLYEKLYAHAILRDDEHSLYLKSFRRKAPLLFDYLLERIPEARKVLESEIEDTDLHSQKSKIKSIVDELEENLKEILK